MTKKVRGGAVQRQCTRVDPQHQVVKVVQQKWGEAKKQEWGEKKKKNGENDKNGVKKTRKGYQKDDKILIS